MARNYPASTQKQKFLEESYNKERDTRLVWFFSNSAKGNPLSQSKQSEAMKRNIQNAPKPAADLFNKLPADKTPKRFNKKKSDFQNVPFKERNTGELLSVAMHPVTPHVRSKLYDGFTKEGRGRYQYLCDRYKESPEDKFQFPLLSSWEYGWRLGDVVKKSEIKKPPFGRTRIVADTFYTRTGIPTSPAVDV
ncbi:protein ATP6V1FNB-like [Ylistrum balloti]|uniref:protein ATP6V1FNB-like n=1 Tax=Ylistrum balloti TaxID=509963 RepID=UPI002905B3A8|nr:protein ATP6V1FNB-like [Ylistrum balloti]